MELNKRKISVIGFSMAAVLIMITYLLIPQPELKNLSTLWMIVFLVVFKKITKKKKVTTE